MGGWVACQELDFLSSHEVKDARLNHLQLEKAVEERSNGDQFEVEEDLEKVDQEAPRVKG